MAERPRPGAAGRDAMQVAWNGTTIGVMSSPKVDNFFVYGPWQVSCAPDVYAAFLHEIDQTGDVVVDTLSNGRQAKARIVIEPDEEIELRFDPSLAGPAA